MEKISLFHDENILLNDAATALNELRLDAALVFLTNYRDLYETNKRDVSEKLAIIDFLQEKLKAEPPPGPERPRFLFQLWISLESFCDSLVCNRGITEKMRIPYFRKVAEAVAGAALADESFLMANVPVGWVYIQTGEADRALRSLRKCLAINPDNAAVLGYLGDAYWERGGRKTARQMYFEACLIDPALLDWRHLRDEELKKLRDDLPDQFGWTPSVACQWLPTLGYIRGLFRPGGIRRREEIDAFGKRHRELCKAFRENHDPAVAARLFAGGIVLCDNEAFCRDVPGIDFAGIKREMQEISPSLFEAYLKTR